MRRIAVSPIGLAMTEPFLEHGIAAKLVGPDSFGHMGEEGVVVDIEVARALSPHAVAPGVDRLLVQAERARLPTTLTTAPIGDRDL